MTNTMEEIPYRLLSLLNPASTCSLPQVLIIHKYHLLQILSQICFQRIHPVAEDREIQFLLCPLNKRKWVDEQKAQLVLHRVASLPLNFSGPPPPSIFGENRVYHMRSSLESLLSLLLLCCLLFPFIALGSSNNGNSYHLIVAFYITGTF